MRKGTDHRVALLALANAAAIGASASAGAQEAATPETQLEEIVVTATGTRISGFDAPTPLTQVSRADLQAKAVTRVSDLIVDVPAFAANQNIGRSSGPIGASSFDLRGLGPARTLLLLDGRRVAPTEPAGSIDTNIIPASLIKSLEIVTGGASAAYGSDAVSGVVNIALDDKFDGIKSDVQIGQSTYHDVTAPAVSLAAGHGFLDDRMHVVGALDYYKNGGQLQQSSRPWGRDNFALISVPGFPQRVRASNVTLSQLTKGGVAVPNNNAALRGIQFGPGGAVQPFNLGTSVGTTFMIGGDGGVVAGDANILPEIERKSAFTRVTYDISNTLSVYGDALYADVDAYSDSTFAVTNRPPNFIAINVNNPFLPTQVRNTMVANNVTNFNVGRIFAEADRTNTTIDNKIQRYGLGVKGEFGATWRWDVGGQYSKNEYLRLDGRNQNLDRLALGTDVVTNPANGQPICRSLLTTPNSTNPDVINCVPINILGVGSISQQALDYMTGTGILDSQQEQSLVGVNFQGSVFELPAGDVSLAVGAEYRKDEITASSDPVSQAGRWFAVNSKPLSGDIDVKEAYSEVVIPVLRDKPFANLLDLNAAVRVTDYSTSGSVTTWKGGFNYSPIPDVRFRATASRDIRAPNINELFSGTVQFQTNVIDPRPGTGRANPTVGQFTGGNPNLTPEESDAYTIGVVYQPIWANSLRMSVDYYTFDISNAIASLTPQNYIDGCFLRNQQDLCSSIVIDGSNIITRINTTLLNAAKTKSAGADVEIGYSLPVAADKVDFRLLGTWVNELSTTVNGTTLDIVNQLGTESAGGVPKWRFVGSARYFHSSFAAGLQVRYIDKGVYRTDFREGIEIDDNHIPSKTYVDLDFAKNFGDSFEAYAKVNNVFNIEPPLAPSPITEPNYNGGAFHDRIGRYYKLGFRYQF